MAVSQTSAILLLAPGADPALLDILHDPATMKKLCDALVPHSAGPAQTPRSGPYKP